MSTLAQKLLYSNFIAEGDLVFDVGANSGNRIQAFLECGANVIAIEPQPDCVAHLRAIYCNNKSVIVIEAAAGRATRTQRLHRAKPLDPAASLSEEFISKTSRTTRFSKNRKWAESMEVRLITLDSLVRQFGSPSFIKIDLEGFEKEVLAGFSGELRALSFEWTPKMLDHAIHCMIRCETLGLRHFHISFGEGMRFCHKASVSRAQMEPLIRQLADDPFLFGDIYASKPPLGRH